MEAQTKLKWLHTPSTKSNGIETDLPWFWTPIFYILILPPVAAIFSQSSLFSLQIHPNAQ